MPKDRKPKARSVPPEREVRAGSNPDREVRTGGIPESFDAQTMAWQFARRDRDHEKWGWDRLKAAQWKDILEKLCLREEMTWAAIQNQSGGRSRGSNSHTCPGQSFSKEARDRLVALSLDEYDLFSLRFTNKIRIYGIREGRVLKVLWYDSDHGGSTGAYPTSKR